MVFYSDLILANAASQPTVVHADMILVYSYQDQLYYCNDAQVQHKILTDKDLANPLYFSSGLLQLNINTTNLKIDASVNTLNTVQNIATTSSPTFVGLNLINAAGSAGAIFMTTSNDAYPSTQVFLKMRGAGYPIADDLIGSTAYRTVGNRQIATIAVKATQNMSSSALGGSIVMSTCANNSSTLANRFEILGDGKIRFNAAYTFPAADGTTDQILSTDGSGNLFWASATAGSSKWSYGSLIIDAYLQPTDTAHSNIAVRKASDTLHSKIAFFRSAASGNIGNDFILGSLEFLGTWNGSINLLANHQAIFNIVSETKYTTLLFKNTYFDGSNNKTTFTCLELNHEKANFVAPQIKLYDQIIQRASSNIFYLPYNTQAANKLYFATSSTQSEWKSVSEVFTSAFGTPANGSMIYHNGSVWTAYIPSSAPSNDDVITWSATGPIWQAPASSSFEKFKDVKDIKDQNSYTLILTDAGKYLLNINSQGQTDLYIPENATVAFPIGTLIVFQNDDQSIMSFFPENNVTLDDTTNDANINNPYQVAQLIKTNVNRWTLVKLN